MVGCVCGLSCRRQQDLLFSDDVSKFFPNAAYARPGDVDGGWLFLTYRREAEGVYLRAVLFESLYSDLLSFIFYRLYNLLSIVARWRGIF